MMLAGTGIVLLECTEEPAGRKGALLAMIIRMTCVHAARSGKLAVTLPAAD